MVRHTVLILGTGNACRSQMAEGFLRHYAAQRLEICSAGISPVAQVHSLAIQVMAEAGIDISKQKPIHAAAFTGLPISYLITVCDTADQDCPKRITASVERLHWPFADPAGLPGGESEQLAGFRRLRDEIAQKIKSWVARFGIVV